MSRGRLQDAAPAARPVIASVKQPSRPWASVEYITTAYPERPEECYVTSRKSHFVCGMSTILVITLLLTTLVVCCTAKSSAEDVIGDFLRKYGHLSRMERITGDAGDTAIANVHPMLGFDEHDVALPIRLHHYHGNPVKHGSHFLRKRIPEEDSLPRRHRRKRRTEQTDTDDFDIHDPKFANYSIEAFGEVFQFHLVPYAEFISPIFTLDYKGKMPLQFDDLIENTPRHCFFAGHVNLEVDHKVVVSLCGGMFGAFRTDETEYLIEPNHKDNDVGTKLHHVHRRRKTPSADPREEICPNSGASADDKTLSIPTGATASETLAKFYSVFNSLGSTRPHDGSTNHSNHHNFAGNDAHSRQKRYISYPRNVEVMVTVDLGMKTAHNYNLQHYVLTLMAIVHHVYLDPSIGNQINIILVKLIIIGDSETQVGPEISEDAHECLRNFCEWQASENDVDDSHPDHYDTAILLTRRDLCRSENHCDTLGLAELGTICDPLRSCAVIEDNGLSTAFTIAHEMGHEFNAPHDNSDKCRTPSGKIGELHVMSPTLDHKTKPWSWSPCSAKFITSFLDHGNGQCLLDDPPQRRLPLPVEEPGDIYDIDQQCSFVYGPGVTRCRVMQSSCARLWCVSEDKRYGCRTPHMPWADGTRCGYKKWCKEGKCVREDRKSQPLDGGWGEWSRFGECSRSCGGGIRIAERQCNNPIPANDGRYCVGKTKKFRSCNWHECLKSSDFRAEQCRTFDWSKHNYYALQDIPRDAEWIPKYDGIVLQDRCKLICEATGNHRSLAWYVLKPTVVNGTPCGLDTYDMCVEGICKRAGCDHILNSHTTVDDCGVCGGDNSGCRTVKGVFERTDGEGYHFVMEMPAGSTNIVIEQRSAYSTDEDDSNYLALRNAAGRFILNGNRNIAQYEQSIEKRSHSGAAEYSYRFDYSGCYTMIERINSSGSIKENISLLVLASGSLLPPNIKYRYNVPLPDHVIYMWDRYGPLSSCNSSCQGVVERKVLCIRAIDRQTVADHKCQSLKKPAAIWMKCNTHCVTKWQIVKEECSSRCGRGFIKYHLECIRITTADPRNDSLVETIPEKYCKMHITPSNETSCYGECLATSWRYAEWSECSQTCGGGTQTRTATCADSNGDLPVTDCDMKVRFVSRICNAYACPQWLAGDFSKCLTTCGKGVRRRQVLCRGTNGQIADTSICDAAKKPPNTVICSTVPCPTWEPGQWGKCSVSCGEGVVLRSLQCLDYLDRQTDPNKCSRLRPQDTKSCFYGECQPSEMLTLRSVSAPDQHQSNLTATRSTINKKSASNVPVVSDNASSTQRTTAVLPSTPAVSSSSNEWRTGDWTQCSATCGNGKRMRYVSCRQIDAHEVEEQFCNSASRPSSVEVCNKGACVGKWRSGAWSECSASCGNGSKARYVQCMVGSQAVAADRCVARRKPQTHSQCVTFSLCKNLDISVIHVQPTAVSETVHSIPYAAGGWVFGRWSECSSSCGTGRRERLVKCRGSCDPQQKPSRVQQCDSGPCPRWTSGLWSKCSTTCGRGTANRRVVCTIPGGGGTDDSRCDVLLRPAVTTACLTSRCKGHRWKGSRWSECSVTCGQGYKNRRVICVDRQRRMVSETLCTRRRRKPPTTRRCRTRRRCPRWHTGQWGKCSVTCGVGTMDRPVVCRDRRKLISDEYCATRIRPRNTKTCNNTVCTRYFWKVTQWTTCSKTCGIGTKRRHLYCSDSTGQRVHEAKCANYITPTYKLPCYEGSCSNQWWSGSWSMCSATCGEGIERRTVQCVRANEVTGEVFAGTNCEMSTKPVDTRSCNINTCGSDVIWRFGPWSKCSVTCGNGWERRQVRCFSVSRGGNIDFAHCTTANSAAPTTVEMCKRPQCLPKSCRQARLRQATDGEYTIQIQGKAFQVYCRGMRTRTPHEYISLVAGPEENYSEIYSYTLNDPNTCPYNGSRNDSCACENHPQSGKTIYSKIRLVLGTMKVEMGDFTFSKSVSGTTLPYAVAGDCYSNAACPQGQFQVNLAGTGLVVSARSTWNNYGRYAVQDIQRIRKGEIVTGRCGGFCGQCHPDPTVGLVLSVADGLH